MIVASTSPNENINTHNPNNLDQLQRTQEFSLTPNTLTVPISSENSERFQQHMPSQPSSQLHDPPSVVSQQPPSNMTSSLGNPSSASQVGPRLPVARKTKSKTNDEKDLDLSFTKRELAGAQARIVQLDAEISDKDKRIQILLETVKNYETNESSRIYNN